MDSPVTYPRFKSVKFCINKYLYAIGGINDIYRKMIMIGESKKVFHDRVCPMILAKTQDEFKREYKCLSEKVLELHKKIQNYFAQDQ